MIEQFIYQTLVAQSAIVAIAGQRIHPVQGDETAVLPAIVFNVENTDTTAPTGTNTMTDYIVRVACYAAKFDTVEQLADLVNDCLSDNTKHVTPSGYTIEACYPESRDTGVDNEINAFAMEQTFKIFTHKNS